MTNTNYTIHKSMLLVVREALAVYLFKKDREEDIAKAKAKLMNLDKYKGNRVPVSVVMKEVETISNMFYDESLGIQLLLLADIKTLPFYKLIKQCIKPFNYHQSRLSFLIFLRIVSNFFSLLTQSAELKVIEKREAVYIKIAHHNSHIISKNQMDGLIIIIYRIIDTFYPKKIKKLHLETCDQNSSLYRYISFLNISVSSSNVNALVYDLEDELYYEKLNNKSYIFADAANINFLVAPLFDALEQQFKVIGCRQRCATIFDIILGIVPPTRQSVANIMNISVSTLQRRLREENCSFQEILDEVRQEKVSFYLNETDLSTIDIAYLLGYKSHGQFFKAFKKWFSTTPRALRM